MTLEQIDFFLMAATNMRNIRNLESILPFRICMLLGC